MTYAWRCLACDARNEADAQRCAVCQCPASPTVREIEHHRPRPEAPVAPALSEDAKLALVRQAVAASRYVRWYRASLCAFVFALLIPNGAGLYMLATGFLAAPYSLAWFANPFLIAAYFLARPARDPGQWRAFPYCALALMFAQPMDLLARFSPAPFLPWLASGVVLAVGVERYRAAYRRGLSERSTASTGRHSPSM